MSSDIAEAMKLKLYEHIIGLAHDSIDIIQIKVYENAKQPIPQTVIDSILGRTQSKAISKPASPQPNSGISTAPNTPGINETVTTEADNREGKKEDTAKPY